MRQIIVLLHRWAGLSIALFLIITGLTGSLIAFQYELDSWLNPDFFTAKSKGDMLPPEEFIARIESTDSRIRVRYIPLKITVGNSASLFVNPRFNIETNKPYQLDYNQVFADPVTGEILGTRQWGVFTLDRHGLMPFIYRLHNSLSIPGVWGRLLLGVVAIVWLFDCFFGLALTMPRAGPFISKWKAAWKVRAGASSYKLNFDLHRAIGLWLWVMLIIIALSGIQLNLDQQVFRPVVDVFSPVTRSPFDDLKSRPLEMKVNTISLKQAINRATIEAKKRGLSTPSGVSYYSQYGLYVFDLGLAQHEIEAGLGSSRIVLDDIDGNVLGIQVPGEGSSGDIFTQLQFPLHSGHIFGMTGRVIISIMGLVVTMLSVTGIIIWWRKRKSRKHIGARRAV